MNILLDQKPFLIVSLIVLTIVSLPRANSANEEASKETEQTTQSAKIEETVLGMNVSGNKEAPNLLYIIPWKDSTEHSKPPEINRLMDEVYSTVDPDVYDKEVGFYRELTQANSQKTDVD